MERHLEPQLQACKAIGSFLADRKLITDTYLSQIVVGTVGRATDTFAAITRLAVDGAVVQAAMLCRSLFEDMTVMHWLVLHDKNPGFLIKRFFDHTDAMRLNDATVATRHGHGERTPDFSDLVGREPELRTAFGEHAERNWWGVRPDGSKIGLAGLVDELEATERFSPRFRGEKPILREMFDKAQKWNNQLLHHTAAGLPVSLNREQERKPAPAAVPLPIVVLSQAYWVYGQLVYLVLQDIDPTDDWRGFEMLFLDGIYNVFLPAAGASE